MRAWLSLGSNLHDPVKQLKLALNQLDQAAGIMLLQTSSFYQTPPWGDEQQADFINAAAQIETSLEPLQLLNRLQSIENTMGRIRDGGRWGPRVIDIDLLLLGELRCNTAELELPHPRMHERAFVLLPLAELDSSLLIPGHGEVKDLLSHVVCDGIELVVHDVD